MLAGIGVDARVALMRRRGTVEAPAPLVLPAYLGSTLRGAFGRAFRAPRVGERCPIPTTTSAGLTLAEFAAVPCPAGGAGMRVLAQTRPQHAADFVRRPGFHVPGDSPRWRASVAADGSTSIAGT